MRGYVLLVTVSWLIISCAGPTKSEKRPPNPTTSTQSSQNRETYATDPMGIAQRWSDSPPEAAPADARSTLQSWETPVVLRVARSAPDQFSALLAESDSKESEALLLIIERDGSNWQVRSVERGDAAFLWPRM